jgi:hypothetical protein
VLVKFFSFRVFLSALVMYWLSFENNRIVTRYVANYSSVVLVILCMLYLIWQEKGP